MPHGKHVGSDEWQAIAVTLIRESLRLRGKCICGVCLEAKLAEIRTAQSEREHTETKFIVEMTAAEHAAYEAWRASA